LSLRRHSATKFADGAQHLAAIAKDDTEIFQVLICQVAEDGEINAVLGEALGVLGHAKVFEPVRNVLHRGHQQFVAGPQSPLSLYQYFHNSTSRIPNTDMIKPNTDMIKFFNTK
jgi:hypothetical protein